MWELSNYNNKNYALENEAREIITNKNVVNETEGSNFFLKKERDREKQREREKAANQLTERI